MTADRTSIVASAVSCQIGGRTIVSGVDFASTGGELVAVVGPNGAGKSTLLSMLAGDIDPTGGEVTVGGLNPYQTPPATLALIRAYLGPRPLTDVVFSVRDVVEMGRHPHRKARSLTTAGDEALIYEAMLAADITDHADQSVSELSSGEAQRVGIAKLLCQETPIALLDEPTSSLDIGHQSLVMQALADRAKEGVAVVTVIHDLNLAARFADRLVLMAKASVVAEGPPAEVLKADLLTEVYSFPVSVVPNPKTGDPLVVPGD